MLAKEQATRIDQEDDLNDDEIIGDEPSTWRDEGFDFEAYRQSQARKELRRAVRTHRRRIKRSDRRELEEHEPDTRSDQIRRLRAKIAWISIQLSGAEAPERREHLEGSLLEAELELIEFQVHTQHAPRRHAA